MRNRRRHDTWMRSPALWFAGTGALLMGVMLYKMFPELRRYLRMRRM